MLFEYIKSNSSQFQIKFNKDIDPNLEIEQHNLRTHGDLIWQDNRANKRYRTKI